MFHRSSQPLIRIVLAALLALFLTRGAEAIDTEAKQAILIDYHTGAVLLDKNADQIMYPASMTKIMTTYMLFERLQNGSFSLDDTLPVSEKAWRKQGSKMFIEVGARIRVEDLLRGIVVQSGNDATIAVAEGIAGSEEAFAEQMTAKARALGMNDTVFRNASGWPDPDHVTTAHDLARLAVAMIRDFPNLYHYYSEKEFTFSEIKQANRNPLLYRNIGADGLKTGHTEDSGYGLTASAERNGRRLVLVINGLDSVQQRALEAERLIDWGFRDWENYKLFDGGEKVADATVWLGDQETVPLVIEKPLVVTLPRRSRKDMKVAVVYEEPIAAPVAAGAQIARLTVSAPGYEGLSVPLTAGAGAEQKGPFGRLTAALHYLVWGKGS